MKKPVTTTTVNTPPSTAKATNKKPPVPDYYLTDLPPEKGRANIKIEFEEGKATAHASVPATHLTSFTGLTIGTLAVAAPTLAVGIACYAQLLAAAVIALTAMVSGVSLSALALLFYMLHKGEHSRSSPRRTD